MMTNVPQSAGSLQINVHAFIEAIETDRKFSLIVDEQREALLQKLEAFEVAAEAGTGPENLTPDNPLHGELLAIFREAQKKWNDLLTWAREESQRPVTEEEAQRTDAFVEEVMVMQDEVVSELAVAEKGTRDKLETYVKGTKEAAEREHWQNVLKGKPDNADGPSFSQAA